jgi:rhodanese-related sulfurtransferase
VRLARIGFDAVVGALADPVRAFSEHPEHVTRASRLTAEALDERRSDVADLVLVDIRNPGEVALGTIPGARHVALSGLLDRLDELDRNAPTVVFCAGGYRSSVAASLLRAHGFADVSDLLGGYSAWINHHTDPQPGIAGLHLTGAH